MTADMEVSRLLGEVAALADEIEDAESAQRARDEAGAVSAQAARVVVVGEKKRGKSSLINALLRRPGLLPVDVDIATSVHITLFYAPSEQAVVVDETHPEGLPITLDRIAEYAALDPRTQEMRHFGVREVSVGLPEQLLGAGLDLVDTPGVGGLVAGHAALTLAALSQADALLFVVNGSSELTASECKFLARATERIASVVFVLTQTDKYPKWRDTLAASQRLVAAHASRFAAAPWFAVSSRFREDALREAAAGRAERAEVLESRSGFGPLERALAGGIAARAGELRAANAAYAARQVLDKLTKDTKERQRSLHRDPQLLEVLAARTAALKAGGLADAGWKSELDRGFRELTERASLEYQRNLTILQVTAESWANEADTATATQIAHDFDAGLQAIWADLRTQVGEGVVEIAAALARSLGEEGIDVLGADVPYPEQLAARSLLRTSDPRASGFGGVLQRVVPAMPAISGTTLVAHMLFAAVNPLWIVAIGGFAGMQLMGANAERAERQRARVDVQRHIVSVAGQARFEFGNALRNLIDSLRQQLIETTQARMRARLAELNRAHAEAKRNLAKSDQALEPQLTECKRVLTQLAGLSQRAQALTARDGALGLSGPGQPGGGPP